VRAAAGRILLVVALTGSLLVTPTPATAADHRPGPCAFHRGDDEDVTHFSRRLIRCAVDEFGPVPGGARRAICIAKRESGLLPTARSASSMYLGLFQHSAGAWPDRYETWTDPTWELPRSALKGRTNSIVTILMVADVGRWRVAGWPVKDC
jgi:hypothetical protein